MHGCLSDFPCQSESEVVALLFGNPQDKPYTLHEKWWQCKYSDKTSILVAC